MKSTNSHDLEVQARQQPIPHSRSLAFNSAVAMRVGSADLRGRDRQRPQPERLRQPPRHARQERQARRRRLVLEPAKWQSAEGSASSPSPSTGGTARASPAATPLGRAQRRALHAVDFARGQARARTARAHHRPARQRGCAPRPTSSALATAPATAPQRSKADRSIATDAKVLYQEFGDSWRISQKESLFTYARHKSSSSYTISGFPEQTFYLGGVSTTTAQQATNACIQSGITNRALLAGLRVRCRGHRRVRLCVRRRAAAERSPGRARRCPRPPAARPRRPLRRPPLPRRRRPTPGSTSAPAPRTRRSPMTPAAARPTSPGRTRRAPTSSTCAPCRPVRARATAAPARTS